ncbi:MAG TPA: M20/M25/M40 family metallo-hydrolase [Bacteroidales bacterium]|nr:M20/M25/M40 family metallo-hydrolase [Bacteroidales bacterium]
MKNLIILVSFLFLPICLTAQDNDEISLLKAMHTISSHDLLDYVKIQCNDKYEGRLTGTPGYQECAEWLADEFMKSGLTPGGDKGTWFQWFNIPYTLVLPGCGLSLNLAAKDGSTTKKNYMYISEYMPGSTSGSGEITGEVVYAGYGITAPELGYDDYAGIDVKGKIILIESEAPVNPAAGPEKFNPWYEHSFHQSKLANAINHGAVGMLYNYGPIANPNNDYSPGFIYVHVGDSVVRDVFAGTGKSHSDIVKQITSTLKPASFNTKKNVTIKMNTQHFDDGKGSNVIGFIKGSDPVLNQETIIIGAHLDHLGKCYEVIPGANDNASAVAVMLGVAKALAQSKIQLKRTVAFIAFGAEEQAIMGSKAYIENPSMPLDKSILLNMDGVGIGNSIGANAGENFPELWSFIDSANRHYIHRQLTTNYFANLGRPRLDAARFLRAGVPSLSFYTYGSTNHYHTPLDNIEIIKPEIMEDLCQLLFVSVVKMADSPSPLR